MKTIDWKPAPVLALALLIAPGCREDIQSPSSSESPPALATTSAAALSFRQISAGSVHTCGVSTGGLAYCWGDNSAGQLGDGTHTRSLRLVPVTGGNQFVQISAGHLQTCGVTRENRAYCWGSNSWGQLGDGTNTDRSTPTVIPNRRFRQIRTGYIHTCGITPTNVAFCWGNNDFGQLGTGGSVTWTPARVARGLLWNQVIAGASHTCGVTTDHKGYCWGANFGQLGDGTRMQRRKPALVTGGLSFRQVVPGAGWFPDYVEPFVDDGHTCGITTSDKAYCWGSNESGVLGTGMETSSATPVKVAGGRSYRFLTTGVLHACGVTLSNLAFCWGSNVFGQLGVGSGSGNSFSPVRVAGVLEFNAVSTGALGNHNCAWTTTDRRAYCWGLNDRGQLGDGTTTNRFTPVAVMEP
jgi:alpha-tubulin suppressor-like RCC1 family protein